MVGRSGSGKTTVLDALIRLLSPMAGTVELFGHDLSEVDPATLRELLSRVGVMFQRDALFRGMTVADNLALAARMLVGLPEPVIDELVAIKLAQVGLDELGQRYPYQLSGGQQKRVAFARAVVLDPELVVCDEPTAGLDPVSAATIAQLFIRLREDVGAGVLIVTHDVELVRGVADRALVIGRGTILATGTADELAQHTDRDVSELFTATSAGRRAS